VVYGSTQGMWQETALKLNSCGSQASNLDVAAPTALTTVCVLHAWAHPLPVTDYSAAALSLLSSCFVVKCETRVM
jgi:hypothetical protein